MADASAGNVSLQMDVVYHSAFEQASQDKHSMKPALSPT